MMTAETWKEKIRETAHQISDRDYQQKTWFGGDKAISSPVELYCTLFDDFDFDRFLVEQGPMLTDKQLAAASNLKEKMEKYPLGDAPDPRFVIDDPQWTAVRDAAKHFVEALGKTG